MRKVIITLACLLLLAIFLNLPQVRNFPPLKGLRFITLSAVYPFQRVINFFADKTLDSLSAVLALRAAQKENTALKKMLSENTSKNLAMAELTLENQRLRSLLGFKEKGLYAYRVIPAEVVSRSPSSWFEIIQISKGAADGIKEDMAVVNSEGLVGRVVEVVHQTAKVQLLIDLNFALSGLDQTSRDMGIVVGRSMRPLEMKYVLAMANIKVGDQIVTSGLSDIFPRGFPIGTVSKVEKSDYDIFQKIELKPRVNFNKLDEVFVIAGYRPRAPSPEAHALP